MFSAERNRCGSPAKAAFLNEALATETDACILWPFKIGTHGYGNFKLGHSHSAICAAAHGPRPAKGFEAAHSCGNKPCCNKRHLRWATNLENQKDKIIHGTLRRGETHQNAKLTEAEVKAIREDPRSSRVIGQVVGVAPAYVRRIRRGEVWSHV